MVKDGSANEGPAKLTASTEVGKPDNVIAEKVNIKIYLYSLRTGIDFIIIPNRESELPIY